MADLLSGVRVLIVTNHFSPEGFRINDLAYGLRDRGHEVTVLTGLPDYPSGKVFPGYGLRQRRDERVDGIRIVRFLRVPRGKGEAWRMVLNYATGAIGATATAATLAGGGFDTIFVFETSPVTIGLAALLLRRLSGIPVLFWVQDLWPESLSATGAVQSPAVLAAVQRCVRFIYQRCDRILVSSRGFETAVQEVGADPERISYLPNWVEPEYLRPPPGPEGLPPLPPGFRILFAGNIGVAQDFPTLLATAFALREHKDIQWIILGEGRRADWVREEVVRLGLDGCFHLLGRFPTDTMPAFFAQADALLMSLRREPIFALTVPSKLQSYLACGRPILASMDGEGAAIVRESGAGFDCPAERPDLLAENVLRLRAMDPASRDELGRRARSYCDQHFDRERLIDQVEALMETSRRPAS